MKKGSLECCPLLLCGNVLKEEQDKEFILDMNRRCLDLETNYPYIVVEYCESSLAKMLEEGALIPTINALTITKQILEGLEKVHQAGEVHGDLKPSNILHDGDFLNVNYTTVEEIPPHSVYFLERDPLISDKDNPEESLTVLIDGNEISSPGKWKYNPNANSIVFLDRRYKFLMIT